MRQRRRSIPSCCSGATTPDVTTQPVAPKQVEQPKPVEKPQPQKPAEQVAATRLRISRPRRISLRQWVKPGVVQLGALKNADKVNEIVGKLRGAGYRVYTAPTTPVQGKITRILVGPDASKDKLKGRLRSLSNCQA
jgi:DedD protein